MNTLAATWLIAWWFMCLWGFRIFALAVIAKGMKGGLKSVQGAGMGGERSQKHADDNGVTNGDIDNAAKMADGTKI